MGGVDRSAGTVQLEGLKELRKTLRKAGDDLQDLKDLNRQTADVVAGAAAGTVPYKDGDLEASIRGAGTKTAAIVRAGKKSVPYANCIHWGRHYWPCKESPRAVPSPVAARPFLSDAAMATEPLWLDAYEKRLDELLEQVEGK